MSLLQMQAEFDLISFEQSVGYGFFDTLVEKDLYEDGYEADQEDDWLCDHYRSVSVWESLDSCEFYNNIWEDGLPF